MTNSSPSLSDLNGDGVPDIVFGTGYDRTRPAPGRYFFSNEPETPGYVIAVSGATNDVLWRSPLGGEAHTTPRFALLNDDRVPDVIIGGREGALAAFSGVDGALLWRAIPDSVATTPAPYNFFTPAIIDDANADGVSDLVVVYGGDDTRLPGLARDASYIAVLSGADGTVLAAYATPDGRESYSAVIAYERADRTKWIIFGSGGETHGGTAYRAPVASLLDRTFPQRVEQLITPGAKGVMAPATLVELTGDAELDIIISTFDGRLISVNGATGAAIWSQQDEGEEAYHPAAVMRVSRDGRLGLVVSRGVGVFPGYRGSVHRVLDARDGRVLFRYSDPFSPGGAPLAVDLTGDGIDEPIFFSVRYPRAEGARIHIHHGASGELIVHDVPPNFSTTPLVADIRGTGNLELIGLAWSVAHADSVAPGDAPPTWRDLRTQLLRLDLNARNPAQRSWAGYMGTAADGHYRPPAATSRSR